MGDLYNSYRSALEDVPKPVAFVDLERFDDNLAALALRARGKPIRVPTKSIRCRTLIERALSHPATCGLMCFSAEEAHFLHERGFDDLLVAYPTVCKTRLGLVAAAVQRGARIVLTVDGPEQVNVLQRCAEEHRAELQVCLDVDMASRFGSIHFGVRRSPLRSANAVVELANMLRGTPQLHLVGLLTYEAQIAGLPDSGMNEGMLSVGRRGMHLAIRALKARSIREIRKRRRTLLNALHRAGHDLQFVNGGGTGSLESTAADDTVTEVSAGSGLFGPALFDRYQHFKPVPAAGFALSIVRRPTPDIVTCFGGGYVASGSAGKDRLPVPWLPEGAELLDAEGAGEVQTPVKLANAEHNISIGDPILFRHAKAGEMLEHFNTVCLIQDGKLVHQVPTYRGEGRCFS